MHNTSIWIDSTLMALFSAIFPSPQDKDILQEIIDDGHILVTSNHIVDIECFQKNPKWVEKKLWNGELVIELWDDFNKMTSKNFYWSSREVETPASTSFEEAISTLKNPNEIHNIVKLAKIYGIPKGCWEMGGYTPPLKIPRIFKELNLPINATRTDVLKEAKTKNAMELYTEYNASKIRYFAMQHNCIGLVNNFGDVEYF